ncbi:unnamed protein product, partial [marine sediment metagenome]
MADETDRSSKHEETVQVSKLHHLLDLSIGEDPGAFHKIEEQDTDTSIHIEN